MSLLLFCKWFAVGLNKFPVSSPSIKSAHSFQSGWAAFGLKWGHKMFMQPILKTVFSSQNFASLQKTLIVLTGKIDRSPAPLPLLRAHTHTSRPGVMFENNMWTLSNHHQEITRLNLSLLLGKKSERTNRNQISSKVESWQDKHDKNLRITSIPLLQGFRPVLAQLPRLCRFDYLAVHMNERTHKLDGVGH